MEHRTQIYLEDQLYCFLKEKAERKNISLAQIIRDLIEKDMPSEDYWEKDPIWNPEKISSKVGPKNASENHHSILRARKKHS